MGRVMKRELLKCKSIEVRAKKYANAKVSVGEKMVQYAKAEAKLMRSLSSVLKRAEAAELYGLPQIVVNVFLARAKEMRIQRTNVVEERVISKTLEVEAQLDRAWRRAVALDF